jgi:tRNA A37 N6-isopentenylltransferase MiaA
MEMLAGVRDERATRELVVQENMRYARRQLVWFRNEAGVHWLPGRVNPNRRSRPRQRWYRTFSQFPDSSDFKRFKICQYSIRQSVNVSVSRRSHRDGLRRRR